MNLGLVHKFMTNGEIDRPVPMQQELQLREPEQNKQLGTGTTDINLFSVKAK